MSLATCLHYTASKSLFEIYYLPPHKPNLSRILDEVVIPTVLDYAYVETPEGLSYENQRLYGITLIVHLRLTVKITYMASTSIETVHSVHYTSLKSISLTMPKEVGHIDTLGLIKSGSLTLTPSIETVYSKLMDPRTLQQTSLLQVNVSLR